MSNFPGADDFAAEIHDAFALSVIYRANDGVAGKPVTAVKSDMAAPSFDGAGATARHVSFELRKADVPERPTKAATLTEGAIVWHVNDTTDRDDIGAWSVTVEL